MNKDVQYIQFLEFYLNHINSYEIRRKSLLERLRSANVLDSDLIAFIQLEAEIRTFKNTYEELISLLSL